MQISLNPKKFRLEQSGDSWNNEYVIIFIIFDMCD